VSRLLTADCRRQKGNNRKRRQTTDGQTSLTAQTTETSRLATSQQQPATSIAQLQQCNSSSSNNGSPHPHPCLRPQPRYWANIAKLREPFSAVNIVCQRCRLSHLSILYAGLLFLVSFVLKSFSWFSKICHMSAAEISFGLLKLALKYVPTGQQDLNTDLNKQV